eukprot:4664698-Karenia_brevis.AAC.1
MIAGKALHHRRQEDAGVSCHFARNASGAALAGGFIDQDQFRSDNRVYQQANRAKHGFLSRPRALVLSPPPKSAWCDISDSEFDDSPRVRGDDGDAAACSMALEDCEDGGTASECCLNVSAPVFRPTILLDDLIPAEVSCVLPPMFPTCGHGCPAAPLGPSDVHSPAPGTWTCYDESHLLVVREEVTALKQQMEMLSGR